MNELPRYSGTDAQRDTLDALRALPSVEVKTFTAIASWPVTVSFAKIARPIAVINGGCWQTRDPAASPTVTGFLWVPSQGSPGAIDITYTGPTADVEQTVTLIAYGAR